MQLSAEQQKAIDAQKAQCPFCKIVKGELQSKKVYEDDTLLAILDINPAAKGHMLIMPKEHYPIMPLIPPETFEALFTKTKRLSQALKEGMLVFGDTLFIANGYAAGQQTSHFMLHLIPRENNDSLDFFQPKKGTVDSQQQQQALQTLQKVLPAMLRPRYQKHPLAGQQKPIPEETVPLVQEQEVAPTPSTVGQKQPTLGSYSKESLIKLIESNPQLKELVTQYPEQFRQQIANNPRLQKVFANVDLTSVITHFAPKRIEPKYPMDQLVQIINDNPRLKELLLKQTLLFAEKVHEIPELAEVFEGVDIEALEREVVKRDIAAEQDVTDILGSFKPRKDVDADTFSFEHPVEEEKQDVEKTPEEAIGDKQQEFDEVDVAEQKVKQVQEETPEEKVEREEEKETEEKKQEGADLDLISRLYREMSQKK